MMNPSPHEPPLHPSELNWTTRVRSFVRFLAFLIIGVTGTLAWQSYGGLARETIASWSPHLAWLAPPALPMGADHIVTISRDLAAVRQGVDKLAADIAKLQAPQQGTLDRTSASPPPAAVVPARKPSQQTR
jgi:hypothetical protein